jgi:hypothetical protein
MCNGQIINGLAKKRVRERCVSLINQPRNKRIAGHTHRIVRVVLLDEPAQDLTGRGPVPPRGRDKGVVERLARLGYVRVRRHLRKVCLGFVELSGLEVYPAERGAQLARSRCRRRGRLPLLLLGGEGLEERGGGAIILFTAFKCVKDLIGK